MLPMDRMCNAIQQFMVMDALREKEVYDAMLRMRQSINETLGMVVPTSANIDPKAGPDIPIPDPNGPRMPKMSQVRADGTPPGIPDDIAAVADPLRDPARPVQPFIPATQPRPGSNPFPDLGAPMG